MGPEPFRRTCPAPLVDTITDISAALDRYADALASAGMVIVRRVGGDGGSGFTTETRSKRRRTEAVGPGL